MLPVSARLLAPAEDGAVLAVPPLDEAPALVAANHATLAAARVPILGVPLAELRQEARRQALAASDHYLWENGEPFPERADPAVPLLVAGHQPELFHPGVWAKNFGLARLARQSGGTALNLLIDSDTVKSTSLRVPFPDGHLHAIPFDHWTGEAPWEGRTVADPATFASVGPAVVAALGAWGIRPLLANIWEPLTEDVLSRKRPLGEAFARARRRIERAWGISNREVPIGRLWSTKGFARLAGAILADLPRFHAVYNGAVHAYRAAHGIKSPHHPVADLEAREGWHETPFWAWQRGNRRRERLFARLDGPHLHLSLGGTLPAPTSGDAFVRAWCGLCGAGLCIRSKALTTTLAARLLLADGFIHGLGGGLYDALTDVLLQKFFDVPPPPFLILSATRRLPLPCPRDAKAQRDAAARRVRDLQYNPQRYRDDPASTALRAERQAWVDRQPTTPAERRDRFEQLRRLNAALGANLQTQLTAAQANLAAWEQRLHTTEVLGRRDFSFVLFPETSLRPFLMGLASPVS
jgi:hypothetical protein